MDFPNNPTSCQLDKLAMEIWSRGCWREDAESWIGRYLTDEEWAYILPEMVRWTRKLMWDTEHKTGAQEANMNSPRTLDEEDRKFHFSLPEFQKMCESGILDNIDGFGSLATESTVCDAMTTDVFCLKQGKYTTDGEKFLPIPKWATHIVWDNT